MGNGKGEYEMKRNIAILFGGDSFENNISFYTAYNIANNLNKNKYKIYLIDIKKEGWMLYIGELKDFTIKKYERKMEKVFFTPNNNKQVLIFNSEFIKIDVCFIAIHGKNGEDGRIQGMLDICGIPYIGSGLLGSANCYNKKNFKTFLEFNKIPQLNWIPIDIKEDINYNYLEKKISYPMIVKPARCGSSLGISIANDREQLYKSIEISSKYDDEILIEEFKNVDEIECAMFIEKEIIFLTLALNKYEENFFDYNAKYKSKDTEVIIPAPLAIEVEKKIKILSLQLLKLFDLKGLVRIDFFVIDKQVFVNEINTQPGIDPEGNENIWKLNGTLMNLLEKSINECLKN